MFDSGISVKKLIDGLQSEVDIALEIPDETYIEWLNSLQQLLYTEVIKEQKKTTLQGTMQNPISLSLIMKESNENTPIFEDIHAVYADGVQLIQSTLTSGVIFPNTYYKNNNKIGYRTKTPPQEMIIIHIVKPALVTVTSHGNTKDADDNGNPINVMVPIEFIDLVKSKLRGEAYKLANEDALAAKWLNDYNTHLETFRAWIAEKESNFGI